MLGERLEMLLLNVAVPVCAPRVVVAMTVVRLAVVSYANPDWVAFDPPVDVICPFKVAVVWAILVVELVETPARVEGVTEFEATDALPVPAIFAAVTVKVYGVPFASPVTV